MLLMHSFRIVRVPKAQRDEIYQRTWRAHIRRPRPHGRHFMWLGAKRAPSFLMLTLAQVKQCCGDILCDIVVNSAVEVCSTKAKFGATPTNLACFRPNRANVLPLLVRIRPRFAGFGQRCPGFGPIWRFRSNLDQRLGDLGRTRPASGQLWPGIDQLWAVSAKFAKVVQMLPKLGVLSNSAHFRAIAGQVWPTSGKIWATFRARFGRNPASAGRIPTNFA